jgi:di/tricarboxylate transporter
MSGEAAYVFALLALTVALFASDRLRMDVIALGVILALMLGVVLTPREALAGFGDPLVILIAALFVVGEGLYRTGIAFALGHALLRVAGNSEARLLALLMLGVALLSAFMSNTGAVAVFIPVALNMARRAGVAPGRLLLPLALGGSIGGMLTLIGTPPNLAVSTELGRAGLAPFRFFDFAPAGLLVLGVAVAFMLLVGRRLLPDGARDAGGSEGRLGLADLVHAYGLEAQFRRVRLEAGCPLPGQTLGQALLRTRFGVTVVAVERGHGPRREVLPVLLQTEFMPGDTLYLVADETHLARLREGVPGLRPEALSEGVSGQLAVELGLAEVLLTPRSELIGHSIAEGRFRERFGLSVLGVLRRGQPLEGELLGERLAFGDSLLIGGGWRQIELLQREKRHFTVLALPREVDEVAPHRERAPWALAIVVLMLLAMSFGNLPGVAVVLLAVLAMVLSRCVTVEEGYHAINWQSLVLIAGMLPMALALQKTGGLDLLVEGLVGSVGAYGPLALLAGLFVLTSLLSQFISNTATAVLIAPVALGAAQGLGLSPYPLLMTVALAASTAFSTPVATPVNTLVMGPGGYRFNDYLRVGVPLQLLAMVVTLAVVPLLFPLQP